MTCRPGLLLASMLVLAACASGGAPVRGADVSPPPYAGSRIPGTTGQPAQGPFRPNAFLRACPGMRVSNAPPLDPERWILRYNPLIVVYGIVMASAPVNDVCLSSGKGLRDGRPHEGIDLAGRPPGRVYSAAPGRVAEARNSSGYGLNVVIDHGRGVFTRYAHLDSFAPGIRPGAVLGFGQPVGQMGSTGNASAPHLHFEILTGDITGPSGSFGLRAHDPFGFPAYSVPPS